MNLYIVYRFRHSFRLIFTLSVLGESPSIALYTKHCAELPVGKAFRKYPECVIVYISVIQRIDNKYRWVSIAQQKLIR